MGAPLCGIPKSCGVLKLSGPRSTHTSILHQAQLMDSFGVTLCAQLCVKSYQFWATLLDPSLPSWPGSYCYPTPAHSRAQSSLGGGDAFLLEDSILFSSLYPRDLYPVFGTKQTCGQYLLNV